MMKENVARDAAPNTAPIATSANAAGDKCAPGNARFAIMANSPPMAALHMNVGASNPPDVPDPKEITSAANFAKLTKDDPKATEQYALSPSIAPFQVIVCITNTREAELTAAGEKIAAELEAAGAKVNIVSPQKDKVRAWDKDHWSIDLPVDEVLDNAKSEDYDALVLPGGRLGSRGNRHALLEGLSQLVRKRLFHG